MSTTGLSHAHHMIATASAAFARRSFVPLACSLRTMSSVSAPAAMVNACQQPSVVATGHEGPVSTRIQASLIAAFAPTHLEVHNESANHAAAAESHFKVVVVSAAFEGKSIIDKHRSVNAALAPEFALGLHALSIGKACTPAQWAVATAAAVNQSPACLGGAAFEKRMQAEHDRRDAGES